MFYFEWICCLNKGQECSGILKFLNSHVLCQASNNQNEAQTMGSAQRDILSFLAWMVPGKSFLFKKKSMKNQDYHLDKRQTLKSALAHLLCMALKAQPQQSKRGALSLLWNSVSKAINKSKE